MMHKSDAEQATVNLPLPSAHSFVERATRACGGNAAMAGALSRATVAAEARGNRGVGFAHLPDYLDGLKTGRIVAHAEPVRSDPAPAMIRLDAGGGIAQTGFEAALDDLAHRAERFGLCLFAQSNSFTAGELGHYPDLLAKRGLVGLAATNGPALLAGSGTHKPVFCTNPLAFAAPCAGHPPLLIDQSSSATAFVNIRTAAERGTPLPQGWALDSDGQPTTDPLAAMKGTLLAFGGARGANIALMVEVLAAGLTGANWSVDAPDFASGNRSPGAGLLVIAISPALLDPTFETRLQSHMQRLSADYGLHIPGRSKYDQTQRAITAGLALPESLLRRICDMGGLKGWDD